MTVDVEKILLTDHRQSRINEDGDLLFGYRGLTGRVGFLLHRDYIQDTDLLYAAAACIAEYNERIKEVPF